MRKVPLSEKYVPQKFWRLQALKLCTLALVSALALEARKSISLIKYFTKDCKISFAIWQWPLFALEILQPDVWLSFLYTNLTFTQCCVLCGNVVCTK